MAYREHTSEVILRLPGMMPDEAEFSGEEFLKLPSDQRVRFCTRAAERAHRRADAAPEPHKRFYVEIAQQWLLLAEAIIQEAQGKKARGSGP